MPNRTDRELMAGFLLDEHYQLCIRARVAIA